MKGAAHGRGAARVRVGLVGAGGVGQRHARTLASFGDVELAAVADPEAGSAAALANVHGARAYARHEDMLEGEALDAIYICVPPFAHGSVESDALRSGLPIFVEKPLAANLATAERVAAEVAAAGVATATGYHWRCLDIVAEARALLSERAPRLVQASWLDKLPPPAWWIRRDLSGGQYVEQTTHVLDLLRVVVGEVAEVSALGARWPRPDAPEADIDDVTAATLRFESGALGSVVGSSLPALKHRTAIEVIAEGLVIELSESDLVISDAAGSRARRAEVDARVQVDRDFIDAVRGARERVRAPYEEALKTHRLACALARSAEDGQVVSLAG